MSRQPAPTAVPTYPHDRSQYQRGVVHLGVGNFHRAHQAVYLDDALQRGDLRWAETGVSLRHPDVRDALAAQQGLYTLLVRSTGHTQARVIGSITQLLVAPEDPQAVITALADPRVQLVTLTVTEKGYCSAPASGDLDTDHPDIVHDLVHPDTPRSAIGFLHAGLAARHAAGAAATTVLSCDNLAHNGVMVRRLLGQFAQALHSPAAGWIDEQVAFPGSMVDRIVPSTSESLRQNVRELTGAHDAWPVATEPFTQWVIEDRFARARPDFEASGVQFVPDVAPYEAMKLRLLNAAHSCIAYFGVAAGLPTVDAALARAPIRRFVQRLWHDEVIPSFEPALRDAARVYCEPLLARFENQALAHRTSQIAMDGSQKIPLRWLPVLRTRLQQGLPSPCLQLALAAWVRHLGGRNEAGVAYPIEDPLGRHLAALVAASSDPLDRARVVLEERSIFGDLAGNPALIEAVASALAQLQARGTLQVLGAAPDDARAS